MRVETISGTWRVRRRWAPRRLGVESLGARFLRRQRQVRDRTGDADVPDPGCSGDVGEAILVFLAAIVLIALLLFFGIPFLVALGELLFLVALTVAAVIGRVVFRRPWTVDAVDPAGAHHRWSVVGWRRSGRAVRLVADTITTSATVPTQEQLDAELSRPT
jgi:hypothetical protein